MSHNKIIPLRTPPDEPLCQRNVAEAWLAGLDVGDKTRRSYRLALDTARAYFTEHAVTQANLIRYRRHLTERGLAASSINAYLTVVKQFCAVHYDPSPAAALRIRRTDQHSRLALDAEQAKALLARPVETFLDARNQAIIATALVCGLRAEEVSRLRVEDYTVEAGQRVLRIHGKGRHDKHQVAVVPGPLSGILETWLACRPHSDWLFCRLDRSGKGQQLSTRSISKIGRTALDAIDLTDPAYTFHALRHTAACLFLEHTDNYAETQTLLRHASIDSTRIYTHSVARRRRLAKPPEALLAQVMLDDQGKRLALLRDLRAIAERLDDEPEHQRRLNELIDEMSDGHGKTESGNS